MKCTLLFFIFTFLCLTNAQEGVGNWSYVENIDPMSDDDRSYIFTPELEPTAAREGLLVVPCIQGQIGLVIVADDYINSDEIEIKYRFGDDPAGDFQFWLAVPDGTQVLTPPEFVKPIINTATRYEKVVFQVLDYQGGSHYYSFDLTGLADALTRLSCSNVLN